MFQPGNITGWGSDGVKRRVVTGHRDHFHENTKGPVGGGGGGLLVRDHFHRNTKGTDSEGKKGKKGKKERRRKKERQKRKKKRHGCWPEINFHGNTKETGS